MVRGRKTTGTILVAVVVIAFGYILGTFALDIVNQASHEAPKADFDFSQEAGRITITHATGDTIAAEKLVVEVEGEEREEFRWENASSGPVEAGDSVVVGEPGTNATFTVPFTFKPGDRVRVVWKDSSGSVVLGKFVVPKSANVG